MLHTTSARANPRVMFSASRASYFVNESGRTYPASAEQVAHRFGSLFQQAVATAADIWIEYDTAASVATHSATAVELVTALFDRSPKPAA